MPERYRVETHPIVIDQRKNNDSNLYFPRYNDHVWPAFHGLVTNAYSTSCANELIFRYLWCLFRFGSEISHPKGFRRILIMLSIQRKIIALLWRYRPHIAASRADPGRFFYGFWRFTECPTQYHRRDVVTNFWGTYIGQILHGAWTIKMDTVCVECRWKCESWHLKMQLQSQWFTLHHLSTWAISTFNYATGNT